MGFITAKEEKEIIKETLIRVTLHIVIILLLSSVSRAQLTQPAKQLPPSLLKELRLRKGIAPRVVSFADTIKAKSILSKSFRDSVGVELDSSKVSDSVLITIDSAVSLSQKEQLDAMLAELPEYRRTTEVGVFEYPSSILTATNAKVVPFDTTILSMVQPVTRELIPYIDDFHFTKPLENRSEPSIYFEAGVGYPRVPFGTLEAKLISLPLTTVSAWGNFSNTMGLASAIKNSWSVGTKASHLFLLDSLAADARQPQVDIDIRYDSRERQVRVYPAEIPSITQSLLSSKLNIELGELKSLFLNGNVSLGRFNDNLPDEISESLFDASLTMIKSFGDDHSSTLSFDAAFGSYSSAGVIDSANRSSSIMLLQPKYHSRTNSPFDWSVGLSALLSSSEDVTQPTRILPFVEIKKYLSEDFSFGFRYDPKAIYNGFSNQRKLHPFYGAGIIADSLIDGHTPISIDNINFVFFADQYLSGDDYLRSAVRYRTRNNDVVFYQDSASIFYTEITPTRQFEIELGGDVRLFSRDALAATFSFSSIVREDNQEQLPFAPQLSIQSTYTFGSLSERFKPKVEFIYISRTDKSLAFINAEVSYPLTRSSSLTFRIENLLASQSDFWSGYSEYPRAITASLKAAF